VQKELADANSVAEEALSSMTTVRAHAAENSATAAYGECLRKFYTLQVQHCRWAAPSTNQHLTQMHAAVFFRHVQTCFGCFVFSLGSSSLKKTMFASSCHCYFMFVAVEGGPCVRFLHDLHNLSAQRGQCSDTVLWCVFCQIFLTVSP
jgi:ABC-type multidrug transport system fused ATPase/permease subunit